MRLAVPLQFLSFLMTSTSSLVSVLQSFLKTQGVNLIDEYQVMFFKEVGL